MRSRNPITAPMAQRQAQRQLPELPGVWGLSGLWPPTEDVEIAGHEASSWSRRRPRTPAKATPFSALCGSGCDRTGAWTWRPPESWWRRWRSRAAQRAGFAYNLEEGESYAEVRRVHHRQHLRDAGVPDPSSARQPAGARGVREPDAEEDIALAFATALDADADAGDARNARRPSRRRARARAARRQHVVVFEAPSPAKGFAPSGGWQVVEEGRQHNEEGGDIHVLRTASDGAAPARSRERAGPCAYGARTARARHGG